MPVRYVDDSGPGITRSRAGKGWCYLDLRGRRITRRSEIDRLNAIALPPAYSNAWFCPKADGHIQAIGWDAKGRKQYRYHIEFRSAQESEKYARCTQFGRALPKIRRRVEHDLARRDIGRNSVIAAVVRLLDLGRVRVGNESYARTNKSYGATTLRKRHARITGQSVTFEYLGKSGKTQTLSIDDKRLTRVVRRCLDDSQSQLFEYVDAAGDRRAITSSDVNDYLREASGDDFTAKHFRTWGASVIALEAVLADDAVISMKAMLAPVAAALGNTPAIARKSYVHPSVIALLDSPRKLRRLRALTIRRGKHMSRTERVLLALLKTPKNRGDRLTPA